MIEVPIPAGCSYQSKEQNLRQSNHWEYFRDRVVIFCEKLHAGNYTYDIELMPRFSGYYHMNPAKISLMYFPVQFSNEEIKAVIIQ